MSDFHYALGLDVGIDSVGWAVLRNDANGEPEKIENLGVRIFDKAEQPKTGASLAAPRRDARSARRRLRRHKHRLDRIKHLLDVSSIITPEALEQLYLNPHFEESPYQLRAEALERILTKEELARILIHIAQRRGYKSNSTAEAAANEKETGKVKQAISENQQCMTMNHYRTVGEMMYRDEKFWGVNPDGSKYLQTRNKTNDYRFTVDRADVVKEIHAIFKAQRALGSMIAQKELENNYLAIFESQRSFDKGPGENSPFSGSIAEKIGMCSFECDQPRAAKATFTFEYFKLLQDLNHIRLVSSEHPPASLTKEQREMLKDAAMQSPSLTFGQLRKKLNLPDDILFNSLSYGEKDRDEIEKRKWPEMQSYHKIRVSLSKVARNAINGLERSQLNKIATILTVYKNDSNRIQAFFEAGIPEIYHVALLPVSFSKFGSLSVRAMEKLIPYLETGMTYDKACASVYGDYHGLSNGEKKNRLSMDDIGTITNPVVRRAISQTIKVTNAVVRTYGSPDVVRIELAREMGKNFDDRRKIGKKQEENRALNERIKDQIAEYKGDHATGLDIVKFKLFQEQDGTCMYSGKNLNLGHLFDAGYVDVDHIIPYSRCFDDSYQNKVLVLSEENRQKGNRLPFEYFGGDEKRWQSFEIRVETKIKNYRKRQRLLKKHLTEEEAQGFIERNLKDTQYITTEIYNLIRIHLQFAESRYNKKPVQTVNGAITSQLRSRWNIKKIREDGDLHHCLDASVIASTSPGLIQRLTEYNQRRESVHCTKKGYLDTATGELMTREEYNNKYMPKFPRPWERFTQELEARLHPKDPRHAIDLLQLSTYESDEEIKPVFVSRMPNHKVTGPAHAETIRSGKMPGYVVTKTPLSNLKLNKSGEIEGYYNPESDRLVYDALKSRLQKFNGKGEKAFVEPFHKPKKDGTPGPRVDKVKIFEKSTLNLNINGGLAENSSMVRVDVFYVEDDGYYLVPIYIADTKKGRLPNKAVVAHKPYEQWKDMRETDFIFSLYPGDLIYAKKTGGIKLNLARGATGESEIIREAGLYYFRSANISSGAVQIETHDRRYAQVSLGIKTLQSIKKYQVDVLGNYHSVRLPEKRMGFWKEN